MEYPKKGSIQFTEFKKPYTLKKLKKVSDQLRKDLNDVNVKEKDISNFLEEFSYFLDETVGYNAKPRMLPFPKIPMSLFRDYKADGPIYITYLMYINFMKSKKIRKINFQNKSNLNQNLEFSSQLHDKLKEEGYLKYPLIYLHSSLKDEIDELKNIITYLNGQIVEKSNEAEYIVYPFGPDGDPDDGTQYLRTLEKQENESYVHFWYFPDSYDQWISADTAPETLEPNHNPIGAWKVYSRWIFDSKEYNEWMNPIDYETEESQEEQDILFENKQDSEYNESEDILDRNSDDDFIIEHDSKDSQEYFNERKKRKIDDDTCLHGDEESMSKDDTFPRIEKEVDNKASVTISNNIVKQKLVQSQIKLDMSKMSVKQLVQQEKQVYSVPLSSKWFNWNKINEIEIQSLPEFFNNSSIYKTPDVYKEIRNVIISKFRENKDRRLVFSDVRKQISGDIVSLNRIFNFLEMWGLINNEIIPRTSNEFNKNDENQAVLTSDNISKLYHFTSPSIIESSELALSTKNHLLNSIQIKESNNKSYKDDVSIQCNAMPWVTCSENYYQCTIYPDIHLCPEAYAQRRFPEGTVSKDFIKIDSTKSKNQISDWSDQETLLLLEGLEKYKDNFTKISEHVGSKSQLQCIMHILKMPIEDEFLSGIISTSDEYKMNANYNNVEEEVIPFADASNPIMAQISFLVSMVSPEVASAAAKKALEVLSNKSDNDSTFNNIKNEEKGYLKLNDISKRDFQSIAASSLSAASAKAKTMAIKTEKDIQKLVLMTMSDQIKKIDEKITYSNNLDKALKTECENLKIAREGICKQWHEVRNIMAHAAKSNLQYPLHKIQKQVTPCNVIKIDEDDEKL